MTRQEGIHAPSAVLYRLLAEIMRQVEVLEGIAPEDGHRVSPRCL